MLVKMGECSSGSELAVLPKHFPIRMAVLPKHFPRVVCSGSAPTNNRTLVNLVNFKIEKIKLKS